MLEKPPSTTMFSPVRKLPAFEEAKSSNAPASSLGWPNRLRGVCRIMFSVRSSVRMDLFCSAGKNPGDKALTRMPKGADACQVLREVDDGGLCGGVGENVRQGRQGRKRRDIDDRAAQFSLDHVLAEHLAGEPHHAGSR